MGRRSFIASVVGTAILAGCSTSRGDGDAAVDEAPDTSPSGTAPTPGTGTSQVTSAASDVAPFDSSVVHQVEMTFDQAEYDAMISTLAETGEKEWIEITAVIDGVTYERAGARLKGNSSLAGLSGGGPGGGGGQPGGRPGGGPAAGDDDTGTTDTTGTTGVVDATVQPAPADDARPGGGFGSVSADEPEGLPWLIRLDEFVEDQEHQGYHDIVIRSNNSATSLNEAVALDLLDAVGLASQAAASSRFTVNGGTTALRLMIEHPDDGAWQRRNFDDDGALYKAESTGDWSYRGDDPASYDEVFDQEGGKDVADLTPLIEFLAFVNESDDATFATDLPDRLDVDAFATYLAMMDLLDNFDDIDGPGNNAYLWWDARSERFTIVPWDLNLAFGGGGFGGGRPGGGGFEPPAGFEPGADGQLPDDLEFPDGFELPDGFEPPDGFELPDGFEPGDDLRTPEGVEPGAGDPAGGGRGRGGFGGSNPLVERFRAVEDFEARYQRQLTDLPDRLFASAVATDLLDARAAVLVEQAADLVEASVVTEESDAIAASIAG